MSARFVPRHEWSPTPRERHQPVEHRCAKCWGPYGKSAVPCPNEPKTTKKETDE